MKKCHPNEMSEVFIVLHLNYKDQTYFTKIFSVESLCLVELFFFLYLKLI